MYTIEDARREIEAELPADLYYSLDWEFHRFAGSVEATWKFYTEKTGHVAALRLQDAVRMGLEQFGRKSPTTADRIAEASEQLADK